MVDLKDYGWNGALNAQIPSELLPARVLESKREFYTLICEHGEITARLKGSFYKKLKNDSIIPVVGDFVLIQYNPIGYSLISEVLERRSHFFRTDFSGHAAGYVKTIKSQVIAVNFDYVFIMISLNHDYNLNRIERYLSVAFQSGAVPVIVLTKADCNERYEDFVYEVRQFTGCDNIFAISALTGLGLEALHPFFAYGKTIAIIGSSGVGKSTLVNKVAGDEVMKVNTIRDNDSKGRHTTTTRQLIKLHSGALIIDTPGMRELGIFDTTEGLNLAFEDVEAIIDQCKFSNCSHVKEPGCAVRDALNRKLLSQERLNIYNKLSAENAWGNTKVARTKREKLREKIKR